MKGKKKQTALLSLLVPFLICLIICVFKGIYPFGGNCILKSDLYHQYYPFFAEFSNKIRTGGSFMYTWNSGLGTDFISLYAYYLASPLNWLIILCPESMLIEFMTFLIILKISLAGFSFYVFLEKTFQPEERLNFMAVIFSSAYALCGFAGAYSISIMWLDGFALAPLIILGLRNLVKEKKSALYYISLSVCILSNYYIAMIICGFLIFYFIILLLEQKEEKSKSFFRFAVYSLMAGGTGAVLILPELKILSYSGSQKIEFPETVEFYFNILSEFGRMCTCSASNIVTEHWPNLFTGAFSFLLVWLYILNKRIPVREKIPRLVMAGFFIISFSCNYLDFIWHGLHFPREFPARQSFLFSFLILAIGFKAIKEFEGTNLWQIIDSVTLSVVTLFLSFISSDSEMNDSKVFLITGVFILLYTTAAVLYIKLNTERRKIILPVTYIVALAELTLNMSYTGFNVTDRYDCISVRDDYSEIIRMADEDSGGKFYRLEENCSMIKNDGCLYGFAGASQFSSLSDLGVSYFYEKVFMECGNNFYGFKGAVPLTSAMLSVDYFISDAELYQDDFRTLVGQCGNLYLYKNNYCLPLGYVLNEDMLKKFTESENVKLDGLNTLAYSLGAESEYITAVDCPNSAENGCTSVTVGEDGNYYAAYIFCTTDELTADSDNGMKINYFNTTHPYLLDLGFHKSGDKIRISNSEDQCIDFVVFKSDNEVFKKIFGNLNEQSINIMEFKDTYIKGSINVKNSGRLVIPVPNEEGWSLYIDGIKTNTLDYAGVFISTEIEKGHHTVELKYQTPYLITGAVITAVSVLLFVFCGYYRKYLFRQKNEINDNSAVIN